MSQRVFLDSGIFIALLNRNDRWHTAAHALFSLPRPRWYSSFLVVSETYSWFLHRSGEESARRFRQLLADLTGLTLFEATISHHSTVESMLDRLRGTKLTYVDASSLCFLKKHSIKIVWGTDHHLSLTGATVLPC